MSMETKKKNSNNNNFYYHIYYHYDKNSSNNNCKVSSKNGRKATKPERDKWRKEGGSESYKPTPPNTP